MIAAVFSDPNCPFCYATEERLHALGLEDRVQWRGVQHAAGLPVPMVMAERIQGEDLPAEVAAIRALAPEVPIAIPPGKPNSALAIEYAAAALATDAAGGRRFVRSLYSALWVDGRDISDHAVLAALCEQAGLRDLGVDDTSGSLVAREWQQGWEQSGLGGVPLLFRADGQVVYGLTDSADLERFLGVGSIDG